MNLDFLNLFYSWFYSIAELIFLLIAFYFYRFKLENADFKLKIHKLIILAIFFNVFSASAKTAIQYNAWLGNDLSRFFLPPHQSIAYFVSYSFKHFWLWFLILLAISFIFYLFLKLLGKRKSRFFIEGEAELGFLTALISGWPNFAIFLPLVFVSTIIISLYRRLVLKEFYTTLGYPFLLAAILVLIFGGAVINALGLGGFRI